ncbi:hypothetical protein TIFTF001_024956 [Ficus carica]|uniref:Uncharacterized protein n=1 Tax=Ficus carica TaxID=3494 RepID=A0AA88AW94_FICCA|nr:hypothetical protein TIFTF001_024956 [Ficus carica]
MRSSDGCGKSGVERRVGVVVRLALVPGAVCLSCARLSFTTGVSSDANSGCIGVGLSSTNRVRLAIWEFAPESEAYGWCTGLPWGSSSWCSRSDVMVALQISGERWPRAPRWTPNCRWGPPLFIEEEPITDVERFLLVVPWGHVTRCELSSYCDVPQIMGLAVINVLPFANYELVSYHNGMIHHCRHWVRRS